MLKMSSIAEIRRRHLVDGESIRTLSKELKISRQSIRKALKTTEEPIYRRKNQFEPKLGEFKTKLQEWLEFDAKLLRKQRRTARRLYECLQKEGYQGSYSPVQKCVKNWKQEQRSKPIAPSKAFVPLAFPAGEVCQFDWSQEIVELGGVIQTIKVAHFRLAYSRKMFVVAYPNETQEMVFDAHNQAFKFFEGVPKQMIYDNLKTVVDAIFVGKERQFNRRFLTLANHYLFEPIACTPASGWEKGQVENQVGNIREWLFTPMAKFNSFEELNAWLAMRCNELAERKHPAQTCTIAECFAQEQPLLNKITAEFDGYVEKSIRVSTTCLIRIDHNSYSVPAEWANSLVSVRTSATKIRVIANGKEITRHERVFGRDKLICNPWHYLPILETKPGALRHGAPFQEWDLPAHVKVTRDQLLKQEKGDRAFVSLLLMAREFGEEGLDVLEVACDLTLQKGMVNASIIQNEMRRLTEEKRPQPLDETQLSMPALKHPPQADCSRYDQLRSVPA